MRSLFISILVVFACQATAVNAQAAAKLELITAELRALGGYIELIQPRINNVIINLINATYSLLRPVTRT